MCALHTVSGKHTQYKVLIKININIQYKCFVDLIAELFKIYANLGIINDMNLSYLKGLSGVCDTISINIS